MIELTNEQLYSFDKDGYIVIKNVLDVDTVRSMSKIYLQLIDGQKVDSIRFEYLMAQYQLTNLLELVNLSPLFGGDSYRLDHDYLQVIKSGRISQNLHGGGTPYDYSQFYDVKEGKIYNGLVAMNIFLTDQSAAEGGFVCIPGSHKSNFPVSNKTTTRDNPYLKDFNVSAGTVILFTEALTHGSRNWESRFFTRLNYFLKFTPRNMCWQKHDNYVNVQHPLISTPYYFDK